MEGFILFLHSRQGLNLLLNLDVCDFQVADDGGQIYVFVLDVLEPADDPSFLLSQQGCQLFLFLVEPLILFLQLSYLRVERPNALDFAGEFADNLKELSDLLSLVWGSSDEENAEISVFAFVPVADSKFASFKPNGVKPTPD